MNASQQQNAQYDSAAKSPILGTGTIAPSREAAEEAAKVSPVPMPENFTPEMVKATTTHLEFEPSPQLEDDYNSVNPYLDNSPADGEGYYRLPLISGGMFYEEGADVFIRKLKGVDVIAIGQASNEASFSAFIDALAPTVKGIDIRKLTYGDFQGLMYWHLFRSFTKTPIIRNVTSKYGNQIKLEIQNHDLKYKLVGVTPLQWRDVYKPLGFFPKTVAFVEYYEEKRAAKASLNELWTLERFEGLAGSPEIREAIYNNMDITTLETLKRFTDEAAHGILEVVEVQDPEFDVRVWLSMLESYKEVLNNGRTGITSVEGLLRVEDEVEVINEEITVIKDALEKGDKVEADIETFPLIITATDFFSSL